MGWFDHIRNLDPSFVLFLRGICSCLGPSEAGIVYGLFSKEALYVDKASVNRTHTVQVWPHVSQNMSGVFIAQVSKMQTDPDIDFSGEEYGVFGSSHWLSFPRFPKLWRLKQ